MGVHRRLAGGFMMAAVAFGACSKGGASGGSGGAGGIAQCTDCTPTGDMTFALPSPAGATLWTTTTMDKVLREATPPTTKGDHISLFAAKNEFEPFQIVVRPDAAATVKVS